MQSSLSGAGMGLFKSLNDELMLRVLGLVKGLELGALASTCKALYCFANHEELWRALVLQVRHASPLLCLHDSQEPRDTVSQTKLVGTVRPVRLQPKGMGVSFESPHSTAKRVYGVRSSRVASPSRAPGRPPTSAWWCLGMSRPGSRR